ncbi:MAG: AraC family transcriptional regulator [Kangiellaceae bacterium]|nr:AraC family transcriptional regulator [Kangiellaceae bacterium]MCW8998704.1 AraC family transcriptional regulator [Kangiellaceae bacterium]MCW9015645.1 AraC family transcriptional regulator [Kangiellaceae bacterium]
MPHQFDRILFSNDSMRIGLFDCPFGQPDFKNTGPIKNYLIAFPRTAVKIRHNQLKNPFVADSTLVTLYNDGQEYERYKLSDYGDRCDWLAISPAVAYSIFEQFNGSLNQDVPAKKNPRKGLADNINTPAEDAMRVFPMTHCSCPPNIYALFKRLTMKLEYQKDIDDLFVEETVLHIFSQILHTAYSDWGMKPLPKRRTTYQRHLKLTQQAQEILTASFDQSLSLSELANELNCSIYHLCRTYQRITGSSIHQTINQLRLREALHNVAEREQDLATLGVKLGFSDHSHFTLSFRKNYGLSPSQFRQNVFFH